MVLQKTDNLEVMKVIKELKNKKSSGSDDISNEIIKCCSPVVENFLAIAFNKCIEESIFPKCLKIAKVIPIYKKGDRNKPENYRPISLLSSISKIFEKLILRRMMKFCEKNNIITKNQYGFRSRRSCADAIATVTEFMRSEIDSKSTGQASFIDLQKAFDTLDHKILLEKEKNTDTGEQSTSF